MALHVLSRSYRPDFGHRRTIGLVVWDDRVEQVESRHTIVDNAEEAANVIALARVASRLARPAPQCTSVDVGNGVRAEFEAALSRPRVVRDI